MKTSLYFICILLLLTSCSNLEKIKPLSTDLNFEEKVSSELEGIDFNETSNESADFESLDLKENKEDLNSLEFDVFKEDTPSTAVEDLIIEPSAQEPIVDTNNDIQIDTSFDLPSKFKNTPNKDELIFSSEPETKDLSQGEQIQNEILSIDYNAFQNGGSFIISVSQKANYVTEYIPETNQYIVKFKNTRIGKKLARPFLTKDFRQSFEAMNSYGGDDGSVRLVFQLKDKSFPSVNFLKGKLIVEPGFLESMSVKQNNLLNKDEDKVLLSASSFEDFLLGNSKFIGKPISIQVKDESIVTIIQFIAEQVGANIVLSSSVQGNISIKLKKVPWDQALVTIMKAKGLGYVRNGNILRVATLAELKKESVAAVEVQKARKILAPFHVKVFPLSYASPIKLAEKIKPFLTLGAQGSGRSGQVLSEERSSSLIVRDTFEVIQNVATLIKELDSAPLQVMIEAKIVEATKNFTKDFRGNGVNIGFNSNTLGGAVSGRSNLNYRTENGVGTFFPEVSIGGIDFFGSLSASLRLQEIDSKVKILSSPSVLVINNQTAKITQQDEILNQIVTIGEGGVTSTSTERSPVELSLEVTPQVSSDSSVIMKIAVKRQFPVTQSLGNALSSREANTRVIIENNKTAMIGGIYQVLERKSISGAPVLRKLPLLGWLFRSDLKAKDDTELVIFITPRVINKNSKEDRFVDRPLTPLQGNRISKF